MDHTFIKEEIEDTYDVEAVSVTSEIFSRSRSPPIPPTQRVLPSPMSSRGVAAVGDANQYGYSVRNQNEKFECDQILDRKPPGLKRKGPESELSRSKHPRANPSLMSPPLFPTRPSFHIPATPKKLPGYQQKGGGCSNGQDGVSQEDEWRNI